MDEAVLVEEENEVETGIEIGQEILYIEIIDNLL
jgi:hypothetical protein